MKKITLFMLAVFLIVCSCCYMISGRLNAKEIDFHNFPKTSDTYENQDQYKPAQSNQKKQSYTTDKTGTQTTNYSGSVNYKLDAIAKRALKAAENHDQDGLNKCAREFLDLGVDDIYVPQVVSKRTPQCPPIKMELNGKTLSGSTCVKMGYIYKGKTYWVGYCRP